MAEKKRFLDVWIVESNTVYKEVPYAVVVDWIQQGRLLEGDNLRWSGQKDWFPLGSLPTFAAYLPRADPHRADDQAEALERVEVGFTWKKRPDDEDDDVDMIPLIDISLVLLIFFIMTTAGAGAGMAFNLPAASSVLVSANPEIVWIGITKKDDATVYALGRGESPPKPEDNNLPSPEALLARLDELLTSLEGVEVNVQADENLPAGVVRKLTVELERRKAKVKQKYTGVIERARP